MVSWVMRGRSFECAVDYCIATNASWVRSAIDRRVVHLQTTTISANLPPLSEFFAFRKLFRKLPSRPLTASHGSTTLCQSSMTKGLKARRFTFRKKLQ